MSSLLIKTTVKSGLPIMAEIDCQAAEPEFGFGFPSVRLAWLYWEKDDRAVSPAFMSAMSLADIERIEQEGYNAIQYPDFDDLII